MRITCFADFCLVVYVIVDDFLNSHPHLIHRSGPPPKCSDSELITICLVSECRGWDVETNLLSIFKDYADLFPVLPSQSRFNRRRKHLMGVLDGIRLHLIQTIDLKFDAQCVIDSMPVPVVKFHRVPQSTGDWKEHGAAYGRVSSKKQTIFGYKLHLLCTRSGLVIDFVLAPANVHDITVAEELLPAHPGISVLGDKAYINEELTKELLEHHGVILQTLPRSNQKKQVSQTVRKLINSARAIVETVNSQLADQFKIQETKAHGFWGFCARLKTKLTARTMCLWIKRTFGMDEHLKIKELAFPN